MKAVKTVTNGVNHPAAPVLPARSGRIILESEAVMVWSSLGRRLTRKRSRR
jgi:hypothetical protein